MIPKFRAYSVKENIMYYPDEDKNEEWTIDDDTGFIAPLINLGNGMWGMIDKYVLMQSTGLKDKNGVEIFEGDIGWDDHQEVHGQVIFENGAFKYEWDNISEDLFEATDDIEIVGNIYENSELLEGTE
ncbi:YopX family protein [Enterococcus faecalis]|uniref:YopX family protein n=1 Tax=Enterococcus faecalis TaxID=1351 RepID=UPI0034D1F656